MKITKAEFKRLYNIDLPNGKYVAVNKGKDCVIHKYQDDTEGCILVGMVRLEDSIGESVKAFNVLMAELKKVEKKEKITIEIA
jgi:hypothetical protein